MQTSIRRKLASAIKSLVANEKDVAVLAAAETTTDDLEAASIRDKDAALRASQFVQFYEKEVKVLNANHMVSRTLKAFLDAIAPSPTKAAVLGAAAPEPRIYVVNLSSYNAGKTKGEHIKPSADVHTLEAQIEQATGKASDWAIHGYDNFPDLGEFPKVDELALTAQLLEDHPSDAVMAAFDIEHNHPNGAKKLLDAGYGTYADEEAYAESLVSDVGGPAALGKETLAENMDLAAVVRDIEIESDVVQLNDGTTFVFRR